jgi:hypothetical protein
VEIQNTEACVVNVDYGLKVLKPITENEAGFIRGFMLIMTELVGVTA